MYMVSFGSNCMILAACLYVLIAIPSVGTKFSLVTICLVDCRFALSWSRCPFAAERIFVTLFSKFRLSMPSHVTR